MRIVPRRSTLALIAAVVAALAAPAVAAADEGQIIVKYAAGADAGERADARADADVVAAATLPLDRTQVVAPESGTTVAEAVADLERSPDVAYAEPDRVRTASMAAPDDPLFPSEWGLAKIGAQTAWDASTGLGVTVGVIDSGIDAGHADLQGETAGGWNFIGKNSDTADLNGHGTHVAGTIAAATDNGVGAAGVAFGARVAPLRVLDADGSGMVSDLIAAYAYAESHHIRIVNASLGGVGFEQAEYDAIKAAKDVLFVVAAGNGGRDGIGDSDDDPATAEYPCAYDLPNIVCVAATRSNDTLASFSNYGVKSVDIAAPGVGVWSTYPVALDDDGNPDGYASLNGTSMATPHVTGAAALVLGKEPDLTPWQLGRALISSADKVQALSTQVASGGRLNAAAAVGITPPPASQQPTIAPTAAPTASVPQTTVQQPAAPATPATPVAAQPAPAPASAAPATPAPTTTPVAAVDRTAPTVALSLSTRGALTALLKGRLRVKTTVSERATVRVDVRLDARTAKKLHLKASKSGVRIATGRATATRGGATSVTLKLTSAAKRALARVRSVKATLTATATDAAANRGARSRTLTIKR